MIAAKPSVADIRRLIRIQINSLQCLAVFHQEKACDIRRLSEFMKIKDQAVRQVQMLKMLFVAGKRLKHLIFNMQRIAGEIVSVKKLYIPPIAVSA